MGDIVYSINESVESTLQNRPKVYFCCHPKEFEEYFQKTKAEIYKIYPKISFWHYEAEDEPKQEEIEQMNLMVIIVTNLFLEDYPKSKASCYQALKVAKEKHIPLLLLLQEGVSVESYGQVFGHRQYLCKTDVNSFAIPYEEKLKKRLSETLFSDEGRKQIEDAFVASAFLSYRKKDRKYVNRIMELIHANDKYRDVGIWYDEFLTPGEAFNEEIEEVLVNSDLFVLMVTANLLEEGNYVLEAEYPKAVEHSVPMLSVECAKTDNLKFQEIFEEAKELYSIEEIEEVSKKLGEILKEKVIESKEEDPKHLYLIGKAYLYGFKVEKNSHKAEELLTRAANMGLHEAYECLVSIYQNGDGLEADYEKAILWQQRYVEKLKTEATDETVKLKLLQEIKSLAEYIFGRIRFDEAKAVYQEACELMNQLKSETSANIAGYEYEIYSGLGDSIRLKASDLKKHISDEEVQEAKTYYMHALKIGEKDSLKQIQQYTNLGGLLYQLAEFIVLEESDEKDKCNAYLKESEEYCQKAMDIYQGFEKEKQTYEMLRAKSILCDKIAGIYRIREEYAQALNYFKESLMIWEKFHEDFETGYHGEGYALAQYNCGETLYHMRARNAEKELLKTAKIIRDLIEEKGGLTNVGMVTGYKVNYLLSIFYKSAGEQKKYKYHKNAMEKFERYLRRISK